MTSSTPLLTKGLPELPSCYFSKAVGWANGVVQRIGKIQSELRDTWEEISAEQDEIRCRSKDGTCHATMAQAGLITQGMANVKLNRYSNIFPYDRNLVALTTSHYINASWIRFSALPLDPFIIAQGPMHPAQYGPDTTGAWWRMVLENKVPLIVNLARVERGFSGCSEYWPSAEAEAKRTYDGGQIAVRVEKEERVGPGLTWRVFRISEEEVEGEGEANTGTGEHRCAHLHFEKWPNYDVSSDVTTTRMLVNLILRSRLMERTKAADKEGTKSRPPTVVHCSGGVGRSGTLVAILASLESLRQAPDSPWDTWKMAGLVREMRAQRHPWMIEGGAQFGFAARVCAEEILGDRSLRKNNT